MKISTLGPFQAGGALSPSHPAAFDGIYGSGATSLMPTGGARVICSPKLTGKTTQLRYFVNKNFDRGRLNTTCVTIEVPEERQGGVSLPRLQQILGDAVESEVTYTLPQVVNTSKRLAASKRKILALVGVDNLDEPALKWLLSNVRSIATGADRSMGRDITIVIDGSFAVDTLTVGPNSEYPLPQLFPREFTKAEQRRFVQARLETLGLKTEAGATEKLWQVTRGDKFLTQLICQKWYVLHAAESRYTSGILSGSDLGGVVQAYIDDPVSDDFKSAFLEGCWRITESQMSFGSLVEALLKVNSSWEELSVPTRAAFYRGGAVRRLSETEVGLRAPLLMDLLKSADQRRVRLRRVLGAGIPLNGVRGDRRDEATRISVDILRTAFCGKLRALHIGSARRRKSGGVRVNATTLEGDDYTAIWEVDGGLEDNQEAWAILWAEEPNKGSRISHMHLLPMEDRPSGL
jgi:hypothetical protein